MQGYFSMAMSGAQCRAARAILGLSQDDLAEASKVAKATIATFEAGKRQPYDRTLTDMQGALETAGVEFIPENGGGAGVRMKKARLTSNAAEIERIQALDNRKEALTGKDIVITLKDGRAFKGRCFSSLSHSIMEPFSYGVSFLLEANPGEVFIDALDVVSIEEASGS